MNWHEYFTYEPETGNLIWRQRPASHFTGEQRNDCLRWNRRYAGKVAGGINHGYWATKVNFVLYRNHRIIWEMCNGPIPDGLHIDHINRVRSDNRMTNLRLATRSQNAINSPMYPSNTSGVTGVSFCKRSQKWAAKISIGGSKKHLGYFLDISDAIDARSNAEKVYYGEFLPISGNIAI
jgi:hypothetical protein